MINRAIAYARGFLNRLHGAISAGVGSVQNVIRLARGLPTSVELTEFEAGGMIAEVREAQAAADRWAAGESIDSINPPTIPGPVHPALDGGAPGEIQVGVLVRDPENTENRVPAFVSVRRESAFQELVENLLEYIEDCPPGSDCAEFKEVVDALLFNPREAIVPLWMYRMVEE